jgi:hypothetical protein
MTPTCTWLLAAGRPAADGAGGGAGGRQRGDQMSTPCVTGRVGTGSMRSAATRLPDWPSPAACTPSSPPAPHHSTRWGAGAIPRGNSSVPVAPHIGPPCQVPSAQNPFPPVHTPPAVLLAPAAAMTAAAAAATTPPLLSAPLPSDPRRPGMRQMASVLWNACTSTPGRGRGGEGAEGQRALERLHQHTRQGQGR